MSGFQEWIAASATRISIFLVFVAVFMTFILTAISLWARS